MTILKINDKEYNLVLRQSDIILFEDTIDKSLIQWVSDMFNGKFPKTSEIVAFLRAAMQKFNHGTTAKVAMDVWCEYCENGGSTTLFVQDYLTDILKDSGIFNETEDEEEKN